MVHVDVSGASEARDCDTKPRRYAAAGALTGIYHDRLKVGVPYDVDIGITVDALKQL